MADYKDPRPSPTASSADPCVIYDNAVSLDKVINTDTTVTTYTGKELLTLSQAVDKFGFGVAPFTFAAGGTLESLNLLVSNSPTDGFLYKYVGAGVAPVTVTAGTDPTISADWQAFAATSLQTLSGLTDPSDLDTIYRRNTTVSQIEGGSFTSIPTSLEVTDRDGLTFDLQSGGVPDGISVLDAGNSNTAVALIRKANRFPLSMFGAIPDVTTDQTDLIQTALELCAENNAIAVIDSAYWVASRDRLMDDGVLTRRCCLYIPSNSRIEFLPDASIKQIANAQSLTYVMNFYLRDNIKIWNPIVWGDRDAHTGTTGEFGHCYNVTNCTNVYLYNPKAFNAWGDGFYVGLEFHGITSQHLDTVEITGIEYDNISRNGVSFTSGKNVKIEIVKGGAVNRVLPKAGCDIEPEIGDSSPINPTYENCHLWLNTSNSAAGLIVFLTAALLTNKVDITIHSLHSEDDDTSLQVGKAGVASIKGFVKLNSFTSKRSKNGPIVVRWANDNVNFINDSAFVTDANYNGPSAEPQDATILVENIPGVVCGGFYFMNVVRGLSPNTPLSYRSNAGTLSNSLMSFVDFTLPQGSTSASGRITSTSNVIGKCTGTAFQLASNQLGYDKVALYPTTGDGITVTLSNNTGFNQTYTKANFNSFKIKFIPNAGVTLYYGSVAVSSVESTTLGAKCEILDIGASSKVLVPISGVWTAI